MEIWKKQKKILAAFGFFMFFMFLCTLISKAVYASKLPQVTVDTPHKMALKHTVEAEGIVHPGREYAVTALMGLRVRTVYTNVGDKVTPETLLFDVDLEDLKEKIQEKELEIEKSRLQLSDQEKNKSLEARKKKTESDRAKEDQTRTQERQAQVLSQAQEELEDAEDAYDDHTDHPVKTTSSKTRKAKQAAYDAWTKTEKELKDAMDQAKEAWEEAQKKAEDLAQAGEENSQALEDARKAEQEAKKAFEDAKDAYEKHMENQVEKPDFSAEDAKKAEWESEKEALKKAVEDAGKALEEAQKTRSDALLDADRKVEDTLLDADADSSLTISRMELAVLETELAAYKKVQDAAGQVYPEAEGIITRIQVSPGERIGDGAAMVYADLTSPMQFQVSFTKDQKKYVNQGDTADLTLGSSSGREVSVDYIAENEMNPELYDARIFLPDGVGTIGQSGSLKAEVQSESFSCCIPLSALHTDENQRNFVYVVSERAGILGNELVAEQIYVQVADQNDTYAAIEEGLIDRDTELIVSATENLSDRDVIRYKE